MRVEHTAPKPLNAGDQIRERLKEGLTAQEWRELQALAAGAAGRGDAQASKWLKAFNLPVLKDSQLRDAYARRVLDSKKLAG